MKNRKNISPPKWADRFLKFYCHEQYLEEIKGDVHELFEVRLNEKGPRKARRLFVWDVFRFFKWSNIKKKRNINSNSLVMIINNFKIAFRILKKDKIPSLINTLSLTLGITAVSLIYLFVNDELTYDRFHEKEAQIYRLTKHMLNSDGAVNEISGYHPLPLAGALKNDFPEIEKVTRIGGDEFFIKNGDYLAQESVFFADSTVFEIFSFPLVSGDAKTVFDLAQSAVISESAALRVFGTKDVIGESLEIKLDSKFQEYIISGVAADIPHNSTIRFEVLLPYSQLPYYADYKNYWRLNTDETYLLLNARTDVGTFEQEIEMHWTKYLAEDVEEMEQTGEVPLKYRLQPLSDIHLNTAVTGFSQASDPVYSYILGSIALVILVLGCSNFMLLSIGKSTNRSKEIAVRKVIGAKKGQLIEQFCTEAFTLSLISAIFALGLVYLLLPTFNSLSNKEFEFGQLLEIKTISIVLMISVVSGLLSALYPAFVLSGLKVLDIFKRKVKFGGTNLFSKSLITFQFALSVMLLLGTLTIYQQLDFLKSKDLGFQREDQIVVKNRLGSASKEFGVFKNKLLENPNIESFTAASSSFAKGSMRSSFINESGAEIPYFIYRIEPSYLKTLGIEIKEGRNFNPNLSTDSVESVIVNQVMMDELGPDFKVGDKIVGLKNAGLNAPRVIGVVKNYHFQSLQSTVKPVILSIYKYSGIGLGDMIINIRPNTASTVLSFLEETWNQIAPESIFTYSFLDDDMNSQYAEQQRWAKIIEYSAVWAIVISALGLLGLAMLIIVSKTKEIGVRKVLGANARQIYIVVSQQFNWLMLIAVLVGVPTAAYIMQIWLEGFAYHVQVNPVLMATSVISVFMITLLMVGINSFRASNKNPIEALKGE